MKKAEEVVEDQVEHVSKVGDSIVRLSPKVLYRSDDFLSEPRLPINIQLKHVLGEWREYFEDVEGDNGLELLDIVGDVGWEGNGEDEQIDHNLHR